MREIFKSKRERKLEELKLKQAAKYFKKDERNQEAFMQHGEIVSYKLSENPSLDRPIVEPFMPTAIQKTENGEIKLIKEEENGEKRVLTYFEAYKKLFSPI